MMNYPVASAPYDVWSGRHDRMGNRIAANMEPSIFTDAFCFDRLAWLLHGLSMLWEKK